MIEWAADALVPPGPSPPWVLPSQRGLALTATCLASKTFSEHTCNLLPSPIRVFDHPTHIHGIFPQTIESIEFFVWFSFFSLSLICVPQTIESIEFFVWFSFFSLSLICVPFPSLKGKHREEGTKMERVHGCTLKQLFAEFLKPFLPFQIHLKLTDRAADWFRSH